MYLCGSVWCAESYANVRLFLSTTKNQVRVTGRFRGKRGRFRYSLSDHSPEMSAEHRPNCTELHLKPRSV